MCGETLIAKYAASILYMYIERVVVSTAAFHARVRGSVPGLGGLKETKMFLPHLRLKVSIVGSLRDREVADRQTDILLTEIKVVTDLFVIVIREIYVHVYTRPLVC